MREIESYQYKAEAPSRLSEEAFSQDCGNLKGGMRVQLSNKDVDTYGFPKIDVSGFDQEKPYKPTGLLDSVTHGIKGIFVKDESVGDQLRRSVEGQMTPKEREQFERENEAIKKYKDTQREDAIKMTMEARCPAKYPDTPMHDAIQKRMEAAQRQIETEVLKGMTPQERREFATQMAKYKRELKDNWSIKDPLGTGGFAPGPEPGPAVLDYYKRIAAATDRYAGSK